MKKLVETMVFFDNSKEPLTLSGRFIGLVTEPEYAKLVSSRDLQKKAYTSETKPLEKVATMEEIEDLRFVMTVLEKDEEATKKPTLFFSEPIDMISSVVFNGNITINGKEDNFFIMSEKEVN